VASGGISSAEDVFELDRRGVPACILGRSLYEGRIDLSALLQQLSDRG
jgi:phosphoribosylformimino-5-aminoimidazole carboxamide ribonucleotide (ProFAR) isomerase